MLSEIIDGPVAPLDRVHGFDMLRAICRRAPRPVCSARARLTSVPLGGATPLAIAEAMLVLDGGLVVCVGSEAATIATRSTTSPPGSGAGSPTSRAARLSHSRSPGATGGGATTNRLRFAADVRYPCPHVEAARFRAAHAVVRPTTATRLVPGRGTPRVGPGWSNGTTGGFDPPDRGSTPRPGAQVRGQALLVQWTTRRPTKPETPGSTPGERARPDGQVDMTRPSEGRDPGSTPGRGAPPTSCRSRSAMLSS